MKKDIVTTNEEMSKLKIKIKGLKDEVCKLKSSNEYLNKLLK